MLNESTSPLSSTLSDLTSLRGPACRKVRYEREKDARRALRQATSWRAKKDGTRNVRYYWHSCCESYHLTSLA